MSTANFKAMNFGMPMIIGRTIRQLAEYYDQVYGEVLDDDMICIYEQDDFDEASELAESFSSGLTFHTVEVIGGYYSGFQFFVKEKYERMFDLDMKSEFCIENDDAHDYFGMCRSAAIRKANAEKRRIEKWLNQLAGNGYNKVGGYTSFSDGSVIYEIG